MVKTTLKIASNTLKYSFNFMQYCLVRFFISITEKRRHFLEKTKKVKSMEKSKNKCKISGKKDALSALLHPICNDPV